MLKIREAEQPATSEVFYLYQGSDRRGNPVLRLRLQTPSVSTKPQTPLPPVSFRLISSLHPAMSLLAPLPECNLFKYTLYIYILTVGHLSPVGLRISNLWKVGTVLGHIIYRTSV